MIVTKTQFTEIPKIQCFFIHITTMIFHNKERKDIYDVWREAKRQVINTQMI